MKQLTVDDVSPMAVRSAQLWLWGYLATAEPQHPNYDHDEWNHSDGWDLNLWQHGSTVVVCAYPVENYEVDYSRYVVVAQGNITPKEDALITAYKDLASLILGGK
jgi:hypothetical protein